MLKAMLTTIDNPYDPFDDFDNWFAFDTRHGYHTASFLDRVLITSNDISEADVNVAMNLAIDEIVRENVLGLHRKVTREVPDVVAK